MISEHHEFKIMSYNEKSKYYFKLEKSRISKKLGKNFEIYHIGSTAVPGLGGKRTIDILVLAQKKREAKKIISALEELGYLHKAEAGDKYRIFFNINRLFKKETRHMHIHLMWKTENDYKKYLIFRNYLRKHKQEADRYYSLKKLWFKKAKGDRRKFTKMKKKSGYIEEVIEKAKNIA